MTNPDSPQQPKTRNGRSLPHPSRPRARQCMGTAEDARVDVTDGARMGVSDGVETAARRAAASSDVHL